MFKLKQIVRSNNVPSRLFIILAYGKYSHEIGERYLTSELILAKGEVETLFHDYEWEYTTMASDARKGINTKEFMNLINKMPFHGMHWFGREDCELVSRKCIKLIELSNQYE